jgi:hypothetical protein
MDGARWTNFDILNNNLTQLDYTAKFGHIYQVKIKGGGRLIVVSDPNLLDEASEGTVHGYVTFII